MSQKDLLRAANWCLSFESQSRKGNSIMATTSPEGISFQRSHHSILRLFGAVIVGIGVALTLVGSISLFSSWGTIGGSRYYWAAFLGLPLIARGQRNHAVRKSYTIGRDALRRPGARTWRNRTRQRASRSSRATLPRDQPVDGEFL